MVTKLNNWLLRKHADMLSMQAEREEGQTMVEYGLVLVAVALAALVAYELLGGKIGTFINGIDFS
jgi:Flp pilus assembly pilin Flp